MHSALKNKLFQSPKGKRQLPVAPRHFFSTALGFILILTSCCIWVSLQLKIRAYGVWLTDLIYLFKLKGTVSFADHLKHKLHYTILAWFWIDKVFRTSKTFDRKFQWHIYIICLVVATVKVVSTWLPALFWSTSTVWRKKINVGANMNWSEI